MTRKLARPSALGAPYTTPIEPVPVDIYKKVADECLAISPAMKEDLAAEAAANDDSSMAISSSMKEDLARDADDDRPLFGRHWDEE